MGIAYRHIDWWLIIAAVLLSIMGIMLIFSAQFDAATGESLGFYKRQILWLGVALLTFAVIIHLPLRAVDFMAYPILVIAILMLFAVFFIGHKTSGAARWISLGPFNITPSDVAKLAVLVALARFLAYTKFPPNSVARIFVSSIVTFIPFALVLLQPDLGTSLVFVALLVSLWFWAGLSPFYLILIISPVISLLTAFHWITWIIYLVILIAYMLYLRPGPIIGFLAMVVNLVVGIFTPIIWNGLADYQKLRIMTFLDPGRDPRGAGYQIIQSKIALGSGGLLGKGYLEGSQSQLKFLPERHTDFVFSVLGEEFGFVGTIIVIMIFAFIFYRAIRIAYRCRSKFASYLAWGALTILFFQFFVNVGMTIGLTPVTGLPLPFLSYGGTSLVLTWILIGLLVIADYNWTEY